MSELERQLHLWTPRRPSARLEQRLFAAGPAPAEVLLAIPLELAGAGHGGFDADVRAVQSALRSRLSPRQPAPGPWSP